MMGTAYPDARFRIMNSSEHASFRKLSALRAQIESFAARHAASRVEVDASHVAELRAILAQLKAAVRKSDYAALRAADCHLHKTIVFLADVPLLHDIWLTVWNGLAAFHQQASEAYFPDLRTLAAEHEYLVETICHKDPSAAEDAARNHVEAVWFRVAEKQGTPARESDPLQRAVGHLVFRLHAPLSLRELAARVAFTSPGNLSRLFRQRYGVSFQGYLQKLRLEKAAELLAETRMPVANICQRVGYRDHSRFGQHFKRRFGVAPTQWRRRFAVTTG